MDLIPVLFLPVFGLLWGTFCAFLLNRMLLIDGVYHD